MTHQKAIRLVFSVFLSIVLSVSQLCADEITRDRALSIASGVVTERFGAGYSCSTLASGLKNGLPFYVCQVEPRGFVLVSRDENSPAVLGYSWESNFPQSDQAETPLVNSLVELLKKQCDFYRTSPYAGETNLKNGQTGLVAPLLATQWNSDSTYFELYPGDFHAGGSVPIAMAQVYRFYEEPAKGFGEIEYSLNGAEFKIKFEDYRFNFARMAANAGNPAVDTLVFCMSAACRLQAAGADLVSYSQTLVDYFSYSKDMRRVRIWEKDLKTILLNQLVHRLPVPGDWLDQAFVVDGYGGTELFHFNMGMGGALNGFYLIDFPVVAIGAEHNLLNFYINYHPRFLWPVPSDLTLANTDQGIRVNWVLNTTDSVKNLVSKYIILKDGMIPIAETRNTEITLDTLTFGASARIQVMADFGEYGLSEMSDPMLFITDSTPANIPSIPLRRLINITLGYYDDEIRQPFKGELELIKELEIDFQDQRGIELLPQLRVLRVDGSGMNAIQTGDYLGRLSYLRFYATSAFDYTSLTDTRSLNQLYGDDNLPFDLYDFRHNSEVRFINLRSTPPKHNSLMDLYGADKYFPKVVEFYLKEKVGGPGGPYVNCFVSVESWNDVIPHIRSNSDLLVHTQPSVFVPCYPVPARETNTGAVSQLSWTANPTNVNDVYYNVYVGESRNRLDPVSIFQTDKSYAFTSEPNKDYYWRVEAFHSDTVYYSGIYHFSTYSAIAFPFREDFDRFYHGAPVTARIPFWINTDNQLTGKAVTSNTYAYSGYYSMEVKPNSDAGILFPSLADSIIYIDFRVMNKSGELGVELLQRGEAEGSTVVNSKIGLYGETLGSFNHTGSPVVFTVPGGEWNRVEVEIHLNSGQALVRINNTVLAEWNWQVQMNGSANARGFAGLRFVNSAAASGGSSFIDDVIVTNKPTSGTGIIPVAAEKIVFDPAADALRIVNGLPGEFSRYELYNLQGVKIQTGELNGELEISLSDNTVEGLYIIVLMRNTGKPLARKISIFR